MLKDLVKSHYQNWWNKYVFILYFFYFLLIYFSAMEEYENISSIPITRQRILTTQWVGQAWEELKNNKKEVIAHFFEKTGCAMTINGSSMASIFIYINTNVYLTL